MKLMIFLFLKIIFFKLLCDSLFIKHFGIKGLKYPSKSDKNYICPDIKLNCCSIKDQLIIFNKWKNMEKRLIELKKEQTEKLIYINNIMNSIFSEKDFNSIKKVNIWSKICKNGNIVRFILTNSNNNSNINYSETLIKTIQDGCKIDINSIIKSLLNTEDYRWKYIINARKKNTCLICDYNGNINYDKINNFNFITNNFCYNLLDKFFEKIYILYYFFNSTILFLISYYENLTQVKYEKNEFIYQKLSKYYSLINNCIEQKNKNKKEKWNSYCTKLCEEFSFIKKTILFDSVDLIIIELHKLTSLINKKKIKDSRKLFLYKGNCNSLLLRKIFRKNDQNYIEQMFNNRPFMKNLSNYSYKDFQISFNKHRSKFDLNKVQTKLKGTSINPLKKYKFLNLNLKTDEKLHFLRQIELNSLNINNKINPDVKKLLKPFKINNINELGFLRYQYIYFKNYLMNISSDRISNKDYTMLKKYSKEFKKHKFIT